jgi:Mg/Co/Ni transporter MgtE
MAESLQQLRDLLTQARWEAAAELLRQHGPDKAADAILPLPFEQQRLLFCHLPTDFAAALAEHFPYFHAYVLFHSLTTPEITAIVGAMGSAERFEFLDALPEESWQSLMKTLEEARLARPTALCQNPPP